MSTNIGDIAVRVGADIEPLQRGMRSAGRSVKGFDRDTNRSAQVAKRWAVGVAGAATAVVGAMAAMTRASLSNIDAATKQARAVGLTTSAMQAMTMVAGEAGVGASQLTNILSTMQRQMVDLERGSATATRTFESLGLSLRDLQNLEPDKQFELIASRLNAIQDPALRTATAMEVFGRAGRDAINMLEGYSDNIKNAEEFQRRFGIAVSETDAAQIERANDAVARLGTAFSGLGNTLAVVAAPALERFSNGVLEFAGRVADRVNPQTDTLLELLGDIPGKMDGAAAAEPGLSGALENLGITASNTATELGTVAGWLDTIAQKWEENQALGAPNTGMVGPGGGPMTTAPDAGTTLEDFITNPPPINPGRPNVNTPGTGTVRPRAAPAMLGEPVAVPSIGGGGAVASQMADRLQALQEGLMTEDERIAEWYDDGLRTLDDALAAGRLTEEQHRAQRERLEEEHQRRLAGIRDAGNENAFRAIVGSGQAILQAVGRTNEKAAKAAQALGQFEAMVNAYRAASQVLADPTLPWFAKAAAAASTLAAGIGFATSIRRMSSSGSTSGGASIGSSGGASGGAAASSGGSGAAASQSQGEQQQAPTTTFRFTIQNDPLGFGEQFARQMVEQLNEASANGGQIRGVLG